MGKVDATMQITAGEKLFAGKIQNVFFLILQQEQYIKDFSVTM